MGFILEIKGGLSLLNESNPAWRSGWTVIEATGKAGTSINPDGKAGTWQGFTV